jgi:Glycosyl hydrolases family 28
MGLRALFLFIICCIAIFEAAAQSKGETCTVQSSNGKSDDSPSFEEALKLCSSNAVIQFKDGISYNIWTPIKASLNNVEILVNGNLSLPNSMKTIQEIVSDGGKTWFTFSGSRVNWIGSDNPSLGWINSYGQKWYDANPPGKTGIPNRPHLSRWGVSNGSILRLKSMKPIGWNIGVSGSNNILDEITIDAISAGHGFPFNTDGIGVTGNNVRIRRAYIMNGDDGIAIQNGAKNVEFADSVIGYQTHGMSIGSLGGSPSSAASVSNIHFRNITVLGGLYAARFKAWKGGKGLVSNVTWEDIRVYNVTFPIFVTQTYQNQAMGKQARPSGQSVQMKDFTWRNFSGTINSFNPGDGSCVQPCWYYDGLSGLKHTEAVILGCDSPGSCVNFRLSGINLRPNTGGKATAICTNAPRDLNPRLGFECKTGIFEP